MSNELNIAAIIEDGIVDAVEVTQIEAYIYDEDGDEGAAVSRKEANELFQINDAVSSAANDSTYLFMFVKAITAHVLEDETSPGVLDDDEAAWLKGKIEGDGVVDAVELALLYNLFDVATGMPTDFVTWAMGAIKAGIIADGVVDADEVISLRKVVFGSGGDEGEGVSRDEAEFLFEINDAVTDNEGNDVGWATLLAEAIASHVLTDETSPGELDADEAAWLIAQISGDGQLDPAEIGICKKVLADATKVDDSFTAFCDNYDITD